LASACSNTAEDVLGRGAVADAPADEAIHPVHVAVVEMLNRRVGLCRRDQRLLVVRPMVAATLLSKLDFGVRSRNGRKGPKVTGAWLWVFRPTPYLRAATSVTTVWT
jgi:hypothetical protein